MTSSRAGGGVQEQIAIIANIPDDLGANKENNEIDRPNSP
jgi:hypothetical protein